MTTRRAILEAIKARLEAIRTADGFATDAGEAVFMNEAPMTGEDDPDVVIAVLVGDDGLVWQGSKALLQLPLRIQAIATAELDAPWKAVEDLLGDIKQAMELEDRYLGGLLSERLARGTTRTLDREPGSAVVGLEIAYVAPYQETWGNPGDV